MYQELFPTKMRCQGSLLEPPRQGCRSWGTGLVLALRYKVCPEQLAPAGHRAGAGSPLPIPPALQSERNPRGIGDTSSMPCLSAALKNEEKSTPVPTWGSPHLAGLGGRSEGRKEKLFFLIWCLIVEGRGISKPPFRLDVK